MRGIGVRELRQQASRYLSEVQRGATFEVTDRGRPVAWLIPVPDSSGLEALTASGRMTLASADLLDLGTALSPVAGKPRPSDVLAAVRADER